MHNYFNQTLPSAAADLRVQDFDPALQPFLGKGALKCGYFAHTLMKSILGWVSIYALYNI